MKVYITSSPSADEEFVAKVKNFITDFGHDLVSASKKSDAMVVLVTDEFTNEIVATIATYCMDAAIDDQYPHILVLYAENTTPDHMLRMLIGDNGLTDVCYADEDELFDNLASFLETI